MSSVYIYLSLLGAIFVPLGLVIAYLTHRQRLAEEAEEDARDASGHAAE